MAAVITTYQQMQQALAPIVFESMDGVYNQRADEWKQVFQVEKGMPYQYHQDVEMYGFNVAKVKTDGQSVSYDTAGVLWSIAYYYQVYALAFAVTQQMIDDGHGFEIVSTFSKQLMQSMIETKERVCADVINFGFNPSFTQTGGDGQPLFSNAHPTANNQLQSNVPSTPSLLSQTSLEDMYVQIMTAQDNRGKFIVLEPQKLVVPPSLYFQAQTILKSVLRSDVANNAINPIHESVEIAKITRLTSQYAWFVTNKLTPGGLCMFTRGGVRTAKEGDFDTDSLRVKGVERYAVGWKTFRGIYGNSGM